MLANSLPDPKPVVFTLRSKMACYTSNLRPQRAPILAFTPSNEVCRQLALYWIFPVRIDFGRNADESIASAEKFLLRNKLAARGNRMAMVGDVTVDRAMIDLIQRAS